MDIEEYQKEALRTDVTKRPIITMLGLAGELGSLFSVYKKRLRDKFNEEQFKNELSEEIGDILWYLCTVASNHDIKMGDVARANLKKTQGFFGPAKAPFFDTNYPTPEQLPDHMQVHFSLDQNQRSVMTYQGQQLGDTLSDNANVEDKYRFHDVFHLSFLAHLHWSPVLRRLLNKKRKSNSTVDENEDGARAAIIEEAVAAIIFTYAEEADFYPSENSIPLKLVTDLQKMTSKFEVSACSPASWRQAIHDGCRAFVALRDNDGGIIELDTSTSTLDIR